MRDKLFKEKVELEKELRELNDKGREQQGLPPNEREAIQQRKVIIMKDLDTAQKQLDGLDQLRADRY